MEVVSLNMCREVRNNERIITYVLSNVLTKLGDIKLYVISHCLEPALQKTSV